MERILSCKKLRLKEENDELRDAQQIFTEHMRKLNKRGKE